MTSQNPSPKTAGGEAPGAPSGTDGLWGPLGGLRRGDRARPAAPEDRTGAGPEQSAIPKLLRNQQPLRDLAKPVLLERPVFFFNPKSIF